MTKNPVLGLVGGFAAGFVVASLLHNYPKDQVTRHRHCTVCAAREETYREGVIMGARQESKSGSFGPLARLLREAVGEHEHRYTEWATIFPTHGVPEEHPEIAAQVLQLRDIEDNPHVISALEQALHQDRDRTVKLLQRLYDPAQKTPFAALKELTQDEVPWPERWARIDATLAATP